MKKFARVATRRTTTLPGRTPKPILGRGDCRTVYVPGASRTVYRPWAPTFTRVAVRPSLLKTRTAPTAGSLQGIPTRQTGVIGPRVTTPERRVSTARARLTSTSVPDKSPLFGG